MSRRKCTFNADLQRLYPSFKKGKNDWEVTCIICNTSLSIAYKGKNDIDGHISSKKHQTNLKSMSSTSAASLNSFVMRPEQTDYYQIRAAEATIAFHTVIHHQSYRSLDCSTALCKKMYPDSSICKQVTCARTKGEAIINNIIAPFSVNEIIDELKHISFINVATDASNHLSTKLFPIVIQYFNYKKGGITSKLLDVAFENNERADTISHIVIKVLQQHGLLTKCVSFCGDNCNTNFGGVSRLGPNNVFIKLKSLLNNKNLIGIGCPAHILNTALHRGCNTLPVDIDGMVLKIYNHFSIYAVRTEKLKNFCDFVETEYKQLLYHSKTRWLSLFPAIDRILHLFEALKSYFLSIDYAETAITDFLNNEFTEAYLFFIHSLMSVFYSNIERMEREENSLIETSKIINNVVHTIEERRKSNFTPFKIREILRNKRKNGLEKEVNRFVTYTKNFYEVVNKYLISWMAPFKEFEVFEWMSLESVSDWEKVEPSLNLLDSKGIVIDESKFFAEWCNLNNFITNKLQSDDANQYIHLKWVMYFKECKTPDQYTELLKLAEFFFSIPSCNAPVERIFSLIEAQWTKERNKLEKYAVNGLILTKYNFKNMKCEEFYDLILTKKAILNQIGGTKKYNKIK